MDELEIKEAKRLKNRARRKREPQWKKTRRNLLLARRRQKAALADSIVELAGLS